MPPQYAPDIEIINIEVNLWKKKWLISGSYNPHESKKVNHFDQIGKILDFNISKYENIILLGDFNCEENDPTMEHFLYTFNLKNLVKHPTCFKNVNNPRTIDLILIRAKVFFIIIQKLREIIPLHVVY